MPESTPDLTVGMACYNDFDGVYFSIQHLRLHHPELLPRLEFLVVDNNPDTASGRMTADFVRNKIGGTYVPAGEIKGTSAPRDLVFRKARGRAVLCMDAHVLLAPAALPKLLEFYAGNPELRDLLQGPMLYDDLGPHSVVTHMEPRWRAEMFGTWASDERGRDPDGPPFEIPMHGLGLFTCWRHAWLGFPSHLEGFGGEEGNLHELYRQRGQKTWCLPFLRWVHRFGRPAGVPYPLKREAKVRNYLVWAKALGRDPADVLEHFLPLMDEAPLAELVAEVDALEVVLPDPPGTPEQKRTETLAGQAWSLTKALAGYVVDGCRTVDEATYQDRVAACHVCPHRGRNGDMRKCGLCGCPVAKKALLPAERCPADPPRWANPDAPADAPLRKAA